MAATTPNTTTHSTKPEGLQVDAGEVTEVGAVVGIAVGRVGAGLG